jgi:hypothetical protein
MVATIPSGASAFIGCKICHRGNFVQDIRPSFLYQYSGVYQMGEARARSRIVLSSSSGSFTSAFCVVHAVIHPVHVGEKIEEAGT